MRIEKFDKKYTNQVVDIFFETSVKKTFLTTKEKEGFLYRYLKYYFENYPNWFFLALENNDVLGYICCCPDSQADKDLPKLVEHYDLFQEQFSQFPAHLHINLSPHFQGKGIGGQLIKALEEKLQAEQITGLHLITGVDALNKSFYLKNRFQFQLVKEGKLFMAKELN